MERSCAVSMPMLMLMLMLFALPTQAAVQMHYLHNDHLGTPRVVTNQARQVVWKGQLKPFGETRVEMETISNHRRFPGQRFDIESRLYYNYFRDYDPTTGRYMQSDPIGLAGGLNTYLYVAGNPVSYVDSFGLEISYANHSVAFGNYHSKIIITPENQSRYVNDPRFQNIDSQGRRYATIGAGEVGDNLVGGINRERDVGEPNHNCTQLSLPDRYSGEDKAIEELVRMLEAYNQNQLPYTLFPRQGRAQYNSNSFISGIGAAGGFNLPQNTGNRTPGYRNPVPPDRF